MTVLFYGIDEYAILERLRQCFPSYTFQSASCVEDLIALNSDAVFIMESQLKPEDKSLLIDYYSQVKEEIVYVLYDSSKAHVSEWIIAPSERRIEITILEQSLVDSNNRILIGRTKHKGLIWVCKHCSSYNTPHFNYQYKRNTSIDLLIQEAEPLDCFANLELKYRYDLRDFLCSENWKKLIQVWNAYNTQQVSINHHVPPYINLHQCRDIAAITTINTRNLLNNANVFIVVDDDEALPHFHYQRADGTEIAISLTDPVYMGSLGWRLSYVEREQLSAFLSAKHRTMESDDSNTNYQALLWLWNDQNCYGSGTHNRHHLIDSDYAMPDYRTLI